VKQRSSTWSLVHVQGGLLVTAFVLIAGSCSSQSIERAQIALRRCELCAFEASQDNPRLTWEDPDEYETAAELAKFEPRSRQQKSYNRLPHGLGLPAFHAGAERRNIVLARDFVVDAARCCPSPILPGCDGNCHLLRANQRAAYALLNPRHHLKES
jgi:hypothetical protein